MPDDPNRIPAHLRRYVVEQDYAQYNAVDQAVWRFVLLQKRARLVQTAHPAYVGGLAATGISVERIPRIEEMNACLARFGWGAVCVDGFIPPRAFQAFQALRILPVAADIRSAQHLVYTPAPDIIHEAAGHAPILPEPRYADYLQAIGRVGERAFSSPEDTAVYEAIYTLSEVKELPDATAPQIAAAEQALAEALARVDRVSEAARLSRLYWWTVEYGLVGTPTDYRLYGAGLLSSLGESHSCHGPEVRKLPLTAACVDVDYDITRPQPQLFVTKDFEALHDVLEDVEANLAWRRGGAYALHEAERSGEVATVHVATTRETPGGAGGAAGDLQVMGSVDGFEPASWVRFRGATAVAAAETTQTRGRILEGPALGTWLLMLGPLEDGVWLSEHGMGVLTAYAVNQARDRLRLRWRGSVVVEGRLLRARCGEDGRLQCLVLRDGHLQWPGGSRAPLEHVCRLVCGARVTSAHAGASDPAFHPPTYFPERYVPQPRTAVGDEVRLWGIYAQALEAWQSRLGHDVLPVFEQLHAELRTSFADEWLLRWNLLESLLRLGRASELETRLTQELRQLEIRFGHRQPIASGLRYLGLLAA